MTIVPKLIAESISEWDEVTDEELKILRIMANSMGIWVIERTTDTQKLIQNTVKAYLKEAKRREEETQRKIASKEKKLQAELKRRARTEAKERELFEALQKKYAGENNTKSLGFPQGKTSKK